MRKGLNIQGEVEPGFEEVRRQFERNFLERGEAGSACAVYHRGKKVVDLWGGVRDAKTRAPWEKDTLVLLFSTTKGLASMTLALAHSWGIFDYDEKVASYWPEFAQNGKENITVRQLLGHQAGLCAIDQTLDAAIIADLDGLATILARQKPAWEPGSKHGYHGITLGWYEAELIRRVDPKQRSLGRFFQDEIARPLGLEFYIGLPAFITNSRVAKIQNFRALRVLSSPNTLPWPLIFSYLNPKSHTARAFKNPRLISLSDFYKSPWRSVEIPAVNGFGLVRSVAKAYAAFASAGGELGLRKETLDELSRPAVPPADGLFDEVLRVKTSYSLGYMKPTRGFDFGTNEKAFGTPGLGGSFGYADPEVQVGYAYAPNRMGSSMSGDPRDKALRDALRECLKRLKEPSE